jgi:hypothetical protein
MIKAMHEVMITPSCIVWMPVHAQQSRHRMSDRRAWAPCGLPEIRSLSILLGVLDMEASVRMLL